MRRENDLSEGLFMRSRYISKPNVAVGPTRGAWRQTVLSVVSMAVGPVAVGPACDEWGRIALAL
ncbi:MAG: hypothetical protein U0M96_08415 [Eggerthellaceae bacterium]